MRTYLDRAQLRADPPPRPVATVGVFDGVHRGHQKLIGELCEWSREVGGTPTVVTFREHPRGVIGLRSPALIQSLGHRLLVLERSGVAAVVVLEFDRELASCPAERFAREFLRDDLGCRHLLMGFDSSFGRGGEGSAKALRELPDLGLEIRESAPLLLDGRAISSTEVRNAILKGELDAAAAMLGRPVSVYGVVVHGDGRGRDLGFPTANLDLRHGAAPPHGVYIAQLELGGSTRPALVNIGRRPTFRRPDDPEDYTRYYNEQLDKVEVFIDGFEGEIYGEQLEVFLHRRIRDETRFAGIDELVAQLHRDLAELRDWWRSR